MKFPTPWHRAGRGWYVQIARKQVFLGTEKDEAHRLYHEIMARHRPSVVPKNPTTSPTVVEVVDKFVLWVRDNRSKATADIAQERLQSFVKHLADKSVTVADLTIECVEQWASGVSQTTRRNRIGAIQAALRWAVDRSMIAPSPILKLRKPTAARRENHLDETEYDAALEACRSRHLKVVLITAWETGARPQEILRVEAKHLDRKGKRWVFEVRASKGKRRVRVVYLTDAAMEISESLAKRFPKGPMFRNRSGRPWTTDAINCGLARIGERTGRKFALVDLRHSFATRMLRQGVDPITVAHLMGHSDTSMLAKVYSHLCHDSGHLFAALNGTDSQRGKVGAQ